METAEVKKIEVGSILASEWGYEQTNVCFYKVIDIAGQSAKIAKLETVKTQTGDMCGTAMPGNEIYGHKRVRRKIHTGQKEEYLKIESFEYASPWDGRPAEYTSYA